MKNYSVTFKSLRAGTVYTVHIGGGTGAEVPLKGGAQPFTTQEDDDEDMFTPIRTQSGYLRIVDDGFAEDGVTPFDWKDLIPQKGDDRPVFLTHNEGNNQVFDWEGFLQPQSFSGELYGGTQEREYPIMCQLSALSGFEIDPYHAEFENFAFLLSYIFSNLGTSVASDVIFQCFDTTILESWLKKKVSWYNFVDVDDSGNFTSSYNCFEVLSEICTFWGWTCRTYGDAFVFLSADENNPIYRADIRDLGELATGGNGQWYPVSRPNPQIDDFSFAGVNNEDVQTVGWKKTTIIAHINKIDSVLEFPYDTIGEYYKHNTVNISVFDSTHYLFTKESPTMGAITFKNDNVNVHFGSGGSYTDQEAGTVVYGFASPHIYEYYEGELSEKRNLNLKNNLYVAGINVNTQEGYFVRLRSSKSFSLDGGKIVISATSCVDNVKAGTTPQYMIPLSGAGFLECVLKIGDQYWNGTSWGSTYHTFYIRVMEKAFANSKHWDDGYPNYDGFAIPVSSPIGGVLQFDILGYEESRVEDQAWARPLSIDDLKISFLRPDSQGDANNRDTNTYTASNESVFADEKTIDVIFASDDNNTFGSGLICNEDGSYCSTVSYGGSVTQHPEAHLLNRMNTWGARSRQILKTKTYSPNISPFALCSSDEDFHPLAIGHDWHDDTTYLTLIKL